MASREWCPPPWSLAPKPEVASEPLEDLTWEIQFGGLMCDSTWPQPWIWFSSMAPQTFRRSATRKPPQEWHPAASFRISTHLLSRLPKPQNCVLLRCRQSSLVWLGEKTALCWGRYIPASSHHLTRNWGLGMRHGKTCR